MFKFLKKNKIDGDLYAPVNGDCIDITSVKDDMFANKVLGEGFAIIPDANVICAPCSGNLGMVFNTKHAFAITTKDKRDILVHIGIDTVKLQGKGFKVLKEQNQTVKAGDPIIEIDKDLIESSGYDLTTMVVITTKDGIAISKENIGKYVLRGEKIINFAKEE